MESLTQAWTTQLSVRRGIHRRDELAFQGAGWHYQKLASYISWKKERFRR